MSNRKPATASKRARRTKVAARAQWNKQAVVRSPKDGSLRSIAAESPDSPLEALDESKQQTPIVENRAALQDGLSQKMTDNNAKKGLDFSLPMANMQAYQATLLEVTQANMQFAFEFGQRLATTRSPFEFLAVIAEFTGRRIVMIGKHSKELAANSFWRIDTSRSFTALPGR
jgi:hypothetical protein